MDLRYFITTTRRKENMKITIKKIIKIPRIGKGKAIIIKKKKNKSTRRLSS